MHDPVENHMINGGPTNISRVVTAFVHDMRMPRVIFETGAIERVAEEVAALGGRRVLLVADAHSPGARKRVEETLDRRLAATIEEVVEHVPKDVAARGTTRADSCAADVVVSLGGGSATGLAKAIVRERGFPLLAIPTTYAGSEMTDIWGLTENGRKQTGRDERVRPRTVLYDPELTLSMPRDLTAASGMNALAHCVEAAYALDASPIVRLLAVEGVRALAEALPRCIEAPADLEARAGAVYGAWLAGATLGNATMGIHHKLCHVLGGAHRLPHGGLHSAILPYATAFNSRAAPESMRQLAEALRTDDAAGGLWELAGRIGAPRSLSEIGYEGHDIDAVAAAVAAAPPSNPAPIDQHGVRQLLTAAIGGHRPDHATAARSAG